MVTHHREEEEKFRRDAEEKSRREAEEKAREQKLSQRKPQATAEASGNRDGLKKSKERANQAEESPAPAGLFSNPKVLMAVGTTFIIGSLYLFSKFSSN